MNKAEQKFKELMEAKGLSAVPQPRRFQLTNTTYLPDFYCPEENCYYEIIGTRQAYHANKIKYVEFAQKFPSLIFKIVKPNGDGFRCRTGKGMVEVVFRIPPEAEDKIRAIAKRECRSFSSVLRQAITEWLAKRK